MGASESSLHMAVRLSDVDYVKELLKKNDTNLYEEDENKQIPLELALDKARIALSTYNYYKTHTPSHYLEKNDKETSEKKYFYQKDIIITLISYMKKSNGIKPENYLERIIKAFENYSSADFNFVRNNPDEYFGENRSGIQYSLYEYIINMEENSNTERKVLPNSLKF